MNSKEAEQAQRLAQASCKGPAWVVLVCALTFAVSSAHIWVYPGIISLIVGMIACSWIAAIWDMREELNKPNEEEPVPLVFVPAAEQRLVGHVVRYPVVAGSRSTAVYLQLSHADSKRTASFAYTLETASIFSTEEEAVTYANGHPDAGMSYARPEVLPVWYVSHLTLEGPPEAHKHKYQFSSKVREMGRKRAPYPYEKRADDHIKSMPWADMEVKPDHEVPESRQ